MLVSVAAWFSWTAVLSAQEQPARTIQAVEFDGLARTGEAFVRDIVRVAPGDPLDTASLDEAVTRLLQTGRFLSVTWKLDEDAEGVRVTFELREQPIVTAISFEGNEKFSDKRLREEVSQRVRSPIDWFAVRDGRESIIAM